MKGEFTLILGPMASGKSSTLLAELEKYDYAKKRVVAIQPEKNVRDKHLESRNGLKREALKLKKLGQYATAFALEDVDVIGIDEAFMFDDVEDTRHTVAEWLANRKIVVAASLDISAMGSMPDAIKALLEFGPEIKQEQAVCTTCDEIDARFTLIYDTATLEPIRSGLPEVLPDDGSYGYRPVCRDCFFGWGK